MADVRNLLRNERASRRVSHPHASYTKSGQLSCNLCQLFIKSESLWEGHLRSTNHKRNVQKAQNGAATLEPTSKKRKLDDDDDDDEDTRKKSRGDHEVREKHTDVQLLREEEASRENVGNIKAQKFGDSNLPSVDVSSPSEKLETKTSQAPALLPSAPPVTRTSIDEDEWAAFEREVVPLTQISNTIATQFDSATISAAPITAAELAAQQEVSNRPRKEEELEGEKEDEERRMEEEFEVMEEMEERVKRLKERREALRLDHRPEARETERENITAALAAAGTDSAQQVVETYVQKELPSDGESEEDVSDFDDWGLH